MDRLPGSPDIDYDYTHHYDYDKTEMKSVDITHAQSLTESLCDRTFATIKCAATFPFDRKDLFFELYNELLVSEKFSSYFVNEAIRSFLIMGDPSEVKEGVVYAHYTIPTLDYVMPFIEYCIKNFTNDVKPDRSDSLLFDMMTPACKSLQDQKRQMLMLKNSLLISNHFKTSLSQFLLSSENIVRGEIRFQPLDLS